MCLHVYDALWKENYRDRERPSGLHGFGVRAFDHKAGSTRGCFCSLVLLCIDCSSYLDLHMY